MMSVIVHKNGTLATDTHANNGDIAFPYPKIWELIPASNTAITNQSRTLAGAIGPLQAVAQFHKWTTTDEMDMSLYPQGTGGTLLLLTKEKGLLRYKDTNIPYLHGANNYAIGEGAPFAYGAMFMGATAEQAVAAAIDGSPHCNGHVVSLSL
jgi:hypothetical protein